MATKLDLLEYILDLTPEQVEKIISRKDLLERCIALTDNQYIYPDTFTRNVFVDSTGGSAT